MAVGTSTKWLNDCATPAQFCYSHRRRVGDLVIWDNRSVLYRATACGTLRYQRLTQHDGGRRPPNHGAARYERAAE